tara:strand:- start:571 stop:966 length:396 start_codon:yes stop_codon:yes gene_type:complete
MAHFAQLDDTNKVIDVVFVENSITHTDVDDPDTEDEQLGIVYLKGIYGENTVWKQCSFNTHGCKHSKGKTAFRYNMAEVGATYVEDNYINGKSTEGFIPPKPKGGNYILIKRKQIWQNTEGLPKTTFRDDY